MKKKAFIVSLIILTISFIFIAVMNRTYSYGLTSKVVGSRGNRILEYYDATTGEKIDYQSAITYYGVKHYVSIFTNGELVYFLDGKETDQNSFTMGSSKEDADIRKEEYGNNAYRVKTTNEFKNALKDIFNNHKIGTFYFEYSKYDDIDFNEMNNYFKSTYGVSVVNQNVYDYNHKGIFEPYRFHTKIDADLGEYSIDTTNIRMTKEEANITENFANKLINYLRGDNSDYQKILRTFTYLRDNASYYDDSVHTKLIDGYTSPYDGLINKKTTCIGYSVMFSYLMDKLGIESYVVDNVENASEEYQSFKSTHSWNIVKLNGKFYKVDLTANIFLAGVSENELYTTFNISKSAYGNTNAQTPGDLSTKYNEINNLRNNAVNEAKTTKKVVISTASRNIKDFPFEIPNTTKRVDGNKTTEEVYKTTTIGDVETPTNSYRTSEVKIYYEEYTQRVTDEAGVEITNEAGEYVTETLTRQVEYTKPVNNSTKIKETKKSSAKKELLIAGKKINLNYILFPTLLVIIIFYVAYKLIQKSKEISLSSDYAKQVLEMDIQKDDIEEGANNE